MTEKDFEKVCNITSGRYDAYRDHMKEDVDELALGKADSSEECYSKVREEQPTANAMTWVKIGSHKCFAVINATHFRDPGCKKHVTCNTCIFGSKYWIYRLCYVKYYLPNSFS